MPIRPVLAAAVVLLLAACGESVTAEDEDPVVAAARALPGVDDVQVDENDATLRLEITHDVARGSGWAMEAIDGLLAGRSPSALPRLEIWLRPATPADAEIAVRAYPPAESGDPVGAAYLLAETPGVARAVFDGETADVRVRDASDLAKVADVAAVNAAGVDVVRTLDDTASLAVADVPPRPAYVPATAPWPADPAAPACDPAQLRLELTGLDAALGSRYAGLGATNTGAASCALQGAPSLAFRTLTERLLDVKLVPPATADRVVVPPGGRARAVLDWNAMPTAGNDDLTYEVLLAATPGAPVTELPLTSLVMAGENPGGSLDIVDGGEVMVTAWQPDGTTF